MKRNRILIVCIFLLCTLIFAGCADDNSGGNQSGASDALSTNTGEDSGTADGSWGKVESAGKLVIGLDNSFPPMGFMDGDTLVGFDIDLAKEVCNRLGIEAVFQPIAWESKDIELKSGNIDCIWNGFTINGRENEYLFTDPYMTNNQILVVMSGSEIQSLSDMEGKRLALQKESSAEAALDANGEFKAGLKEVITFEDNMKALMDLEIGQSDAVLMDEVVARYNIEKQDKEYVVLEESLQAENYGVGFRLEDTALMNKINDTLNEMKQDGSMKKLSEQWFDKDVTAS